MYGCGRVGFKLIPLDVDPLSTPDAGACTRGRCEPTCEADFADCNLDPTDGCEADLTTGAAGPCGSCETRCQSDEMCLSGSCEPTGCAPGFAECDGETRVMCETDLLNTVDRCGSCSTSCSDNHGTSMCKDGSCQVLRCDVGFDDCDGDPSNGCETNLATSVDSCGACRDTCANDHGSTVCVDSACVPTCDADYADCDGFTRNGCERQLAAGCTLCDVECPVDDEPVCADASCEPECDLTGTWALKLSTTVSWAETGYVASDVSRPFQMSMRVRITQSTGELALEIAECGRIIPEYEAKFPNERSLLSFPDSMYDADLAPSVSSVADAGRNTPGSSLFVPAVAAQLGISLRDPVNDAWPSRQAYVPASARVDTDRDGAEGVTTPYTDASPYVYPRTTPIVAVGAPRSDAVFTATRTVFSLAGTLNSCTDSSGSAGISRIDARLYGCTIARSIRECDAGETARIDDSVMHYVPEPGSYTLRKVADDADCATIRSTAR